jgi:DNA-binding NarL/FixJ family response regulator
MSNSNPVRLLIAEPDATLLEALALYFRLQGIEVVGQTADAYEARALSQRLKPAVLIVDLDHQLADGVAFIRTLCRENPSMKIVVLSPQLDGPTKEEMLQAGAARYVVKGILASELVGVIRQVDHGQNPI